MKKRIHARESRAQSKIALKTDLKCLKSGFANSNELSSFNVAASVVSSVCSGTSLYQSTVKDG